MRLKSKIARLNFTEASKEAAAIKAAFRREVAEQFLHGKDGESVGESRRALGIKDGAKTRLVGFNGVRFK